MIIIKEEIHHVQHRIDTIGGLSDLLAPGGRMLIAMLPTSIGYPPPSASSKSYSRTHIEILNHMTSVGLDVHVELFSFTIAIERRFPQPILCFQDNFAFLIGRRRNI